MGRDLFGSALELAVVKESQTWTQKSQDGSRAMNVRRECRGCPGLVMVFEKAHRLFLKIFVRVKMLAHRPRVLVQKTVVEALIVGKIKALLLERPFQIPVNLGHKEEIGLLRVNGLECKRPERLNV